MADITLKLIWYRLSLTYSKMATAASSWYTDLDFDSYVLDLLLLAWCAGAAIIVVSVNSLKSALGPVIRQPAAERIRDYAAAGDGAFASVPARDQHGRESCQWFNTAVSWLYLHYYHSPIYVDEWVKALNDQLSKLGVQVFFVFSVTSYSLRKLFLALDGVLGLSARCRLMGARAGWFDVGLFSKLPWQHACGRLAGWNARKRGGAFMCVLCWAKGHFTCQEVTAPVLSVFAHLCTIVCNCTPVNCL